MLPWVSVAIGQSYFGYISGKVFFFFFLNLCYHQQFSVIDTACLLIAALCFSKRRTGGSCVSQKQAPLNIDKGIESEHPTHDRTHQHREDNVFLRTEISKEVGSVVAQWKRKENLISAWFTSSTLVKERNLR